MARPNTAGLGCIALAFCGFALPALADPAINVIQNNYGTIPQYVPSVVVTVGNATLQCFLYYLSPTQIDAILPGPTPIGTGSITVINNGTVSAPAQINVVPMAFGILTYGGGSAAAFDASWNMITPSNPAHPNQTIALWGSGVGFDPNNDDRSYPQRQNNLTKIPMEITVGGRLSSILLPREIAVHGPRSIGDHDPSRRRRRMLRLPTGWDTHVPGYTRYPSRRLGHAVPIASEAGPCSDATTELTPDLELTLAEKGAVNTGFLAPARLMPITATTGPQTSGGGLTASVAYFRSSSFYSGGSNVSVGGCVIPYSHLAATSLAVGPLDADSLMTLTGPSGPITLVPDLSSAPSGTRYNLPSVAASGPIPAAGGVFTFDNGVGGNGVSHFSASVTIPPAFTLTSYTAQFSHSAGGLVTWTGSGGPDTFVAITGASPLGFSIFFCTAPLSAGQFAIPAFVSQAMMPGNGSLSVGIYSKSKLFTAPGLDLGLSNAGTVIQILNASFN